MRARVALALIALLSPAAAIAQARVAVDVRRLPTGADSLAVFYIDGRDTSRTGIVYDELTVVDEGGRSRLRRVYRTVDQLLGAQLDTIVDDAATLAPVRYRSVSERNRVTVDFEDGRASGWVWMVNGDSARVAATLAANVVGAATFDVVLRAADLRDGWEAEIPAFLPTNRAVATLQARVGGSDVIAGEPCWRVEAEFIGMPVTFWIAKASRRLRQQVMWVKPDAAILFQPARSVAPSVRRS